MKKSIRNFLIVVLCAVFCILQYPVTASASGFDPAYYAARYPDVVQALGDSRQALLNHYLTYGVHEGRFQNAEEEALGTPLSTYVDIDITNQTVTYYENGQPVLSSPCVTGDISKKRATPLGIFSVYGHKAGTYLTGPTWKNWVDYWMPFSGGCGLHDANWRKAFGGEIYKTNGSHGCVNLPHDVAEQLFNMINIGTVVVVHE